VIEKADRQIVQWIGTILPKVPVSLGAPGPKSTPKGIAVYLLDVSVDPPARSAKRPPLQVELRYLLTAWDDQEEESHRLLGSLLFAALDNPDFQVEPNPVALEVWRGLGLAPRPSLVLRVPLRKVRPEKIAPPVRVPLVVRTSGLGRLAGRVVGPGDLPLMAADVELPSLHLRARTDPDGRFQFYGIPLSKSVNTVKVRAKGKEITVDVKGWRDQEEPLLIRMNLLEEDHA
jgi:hypothetical protein